jgi:hypothetical protein
VVLVHNSKIADHMHASTPVFVLCFRHAAPMLKPACVRGVRLGQPVPRNRSIHVVIIPAHHKKTGLHCLSVLLPCPPPPTDGGHHTHALGAVLEKVRACLHDGLVGVGRVGCCSRSSLVGYILMIMYYEAAAAETTRQVFRSTYG